MVKQQIKKKNLILKYSSYVSKTNNSFTLVINDKFIDSQLNYFGYFTLVSNHITDTKDALTIYRNKDFIEKSFYSLKSRIDFVRTSVQSSENLEGLVFIKFIALILTSYIHKYMTISDLYDKYSMSDLLRDLNTIYQCTFLNKKPHLSEITTKQLELYKKLDIELINTFYTF
jgi:transposase